MPSLQKTACQKYLFSRWLVLLLFSLLFSNPVFSQKSNDFLDMSLEELLNIKVSVASTDPERIIETPAIVSRYNAKDMAAMGLRTLKDLLSFIPGFVLQDTRGGGTSIMIRGLVEGLNQKVLFLVDDIPYWMPAHSEIPLLGIPIESISHVEVIRGPGAVYYGSNASAGVIKVVTKKTSGNVVAIALGSNSLVNVGAYFHGQLDDDLSLTFAIEAQQDDGYSGSFEGVPKQPTFPADTPNDGEITKSEEVKSFLGRVTFKDLNIFAQAYRSLNNDHDGSTPLNLGTNLEYTGYLFHVDNSWHEANAEFSLFTDYNKFYLEFESRNLFAVGVDGGFRFDDNGEDNHRWRSGGTLSYTFSESLVFFGGMEFERRKIEDYYIYNKATDANVLKLIESNSTIERSIYGQTDYKDGSWRFLLGGRYTNNDQSGEKLVPRASAVYLLDDSQSIKFLYSVGFNSPNFTQLFITIPSVLEGNRDLRPEIVKTTELSYSYESKGNLFVANVYYLQAEDFIQREIRSGVIGFFNSGDFDRSGLELDFQKATPDYLFFANAAYIHQGDDFDSSDVMAHFSPKITVAIGGLYHIDSHHSSGASMRATGRRNKASDLYQLNVDYQYSREMFELYFSIKNVLDEEIVTPDVQDFQDDHLLPSGDGINFLGGVKYHF